MSRSRPMPESSFVKKTSSLGQQIGWVWLMSGSSRRNTQDLVQGEVSLRVGRGCMFVRGHVFIKYVIPWAHCRVLGRVCCGLVDVGQLEEKHTGSCSGRSQPPRRSWLYVCAGSYLHQVRDLMGSRSKS